MKKQSRKMWKKRPGSWDPLHAEQIFFSMNEWQIPDLLPQPPDLEIPENLKPYAFAQPIRTTRPLLIHFHTDDHRFQIVWNEPTRGLNSVCREQVWAACSPDFSLWLEYPLAMQIWNTYRNRWVARLWQQHGVIVIPTVNWSWGGSFNFCFLGVAQHQILTLRTTKRLTVKEKNNFLRGYRKMLDVLEPRHILWFGDIYDEISDSVPKTQFPVGYWDTKGEI